MSRATKRREHDDLQRRALADARETAADHSTRGPRRRAMGARAFAALGCLLGLGLAGASGCGDADERGALDEGDEGPEAVGEEAQALSTKIACVSLKRAAPFKAYDAQISKEKDQTNFGASAFVLSGASSSGPADPFQALFKFDTSVIPSDATILSAKLTLSQTNNGVATANAHLITAPWDEATVTWASLGGAFSGAIFKSFSTASPTIGISMVPEVQAWVNQSKPNHGLLIEQAGPFQTKYKSHEYAVSAQRPRLDVCYQVTCAPGFADCNGDASDGCETSLSTLENCGACGVACALPNASASCSAGACALVSCDAGAHDCDGNPENGCDVGLCGQGQHCTSSGDCASFVCVGGQCAAPSCTDGVKNGDEVGVDCGGACAIPETCNGQDDDCNGSIDEGLGSTICGVGACQVMVQNCVGGAPQICVPAEPKPELCDGADNDCDGAVDDGNPGGGESCTPNDPCHVGATSCVAGSLLCADTGALAAPGTACGNGLVCSPAGACVACAAAEACAPAAACMQGVVSCASGAPVCEASVPVADGTPCAGGSCTSGVCSPNGSIAGTKNLSVDSLTPGRSCAEAVAYSVTALGQGSATLGAAVAAGCLGAGDLLLLINEQGTAGATVNVGNYEILKVASVAGNVVTFASPKSFFYGSAAGSDANIGTAPNQQKVVLQRLPVFGNLSIPAGAVLTVNPWDGLKGGVLAFRAADVAIAGSLTAAGKGYRTGGYNIDDSSCSDNLTTENGESVSGPPTQTTAANSGGSGGLAGGSGISYNGNTPLSASAGHANAGQLGQNPNGRTIGPPGAAYGSGDGTNLTMGSGSGGNLTCQVGSYAPYIGARSNGAGGIIAVFANSISVAAGGSINASGLNGSRTPASGGYVLLRANTLSLGASLVQAVGAEGISSGKTGTFTNLAGHGYVTLDYRTSLSGSTLPAALATQVPGLVLP
jgi:hypothetical protein